MNRLRALQESPTTTGSTEGAHLTLCVAPDGSVDFYPKGDPERLLEGLRLAVKIFRDNPDSMECAVGACDGECRHAG